jgi:hypothetical protein
MTKLDLKTQFKILIVHVIIIFIAINELVYAEDTEFSETKPIDSIQHEGPVNPPQLQKTVFNGYTWYDHSLIKYADFEKWNKITTEYFDGFKPYDLIELKGIFYYQLVKQLRRERENEIEKCPKYKKIEDAERIIFSSLKRSYQDCKKRIDEVFDKKENTYLFRTGGSLPINYTLEITKQNKTDIIDSQAKLREYFAPVETEAKAISFVAMQDPYQFVTQADIPPILGRLFKKPTKEQQDSIDKYGKFLKGNVLQIDDAFLVLVFDENQFGCGSHLPSGVVYKIEHSGDIKIVAKENVVVDSSKKTVCID